MNRQSLTFLGVFLVSAIAVAPFVYAGRPLYGLVAGTAGLLLHWLLSRGGDRDGEVADSSYFFGFLLTLVFLAVGLYRVGLVMGGTGGGTGDILGFLVDLAAGLMLTIEGLLIRQVRTLASDTRAHDERSMAVIQRQLADNLTGMMEMWKARPEHQVLDVLNESRSIAREAAEKLDRSVAAAGNRMVESVQRLDEATVAATQSMTRAAAGVGGSLAELAQRLEVEIQQVAGSLQREVSRAVTSIEQQRIAADEALAHARAAGQQLMSDADAQQREQLELWRTSVEQARAAIDRAHRGMDEAYRRSMESFAASGVAFAELAEHATDHVRALPNPAERLTGLWDGVRRLETDLTQAISGSVEQLGALRERSEQLRDSLARLGGSVDEAATRIGVGGDRLGDSLQHELQQMNTIIEEYITLLERSSRQLKVRV